MAITKYIFERKTVIGPYIDSYFNLSYSIVKVLRRNNLSSRQYSPLIKKYCLEKHNYLMTKARCNPPCSDSNSRYKERIEENRFIHENSDQRMWDGANSFYYNPDEEGKKE